MSCSLNGRMISLWPYLITFRSRLHARIAHWLDKRRGFMMTPRRAQPISSKQAAEFAGSTVGQPTVLIFDSGVGGLSIYQDIRDCLPGLSIIYTFDNAFFPYGEQPESLIVDRVVKIAGAITQQHQLDLIVIACNTASTVSLSALRACFSIPIVGVVPAIKPAVQRTHNGVVGLLATRATINRPYTQTLINEFAVNCRVELLGSARLVEIAEEKLYGQPVKLQEISEILHPWLALPVCPDTIVLGCTHFPLLRDELMAVLPANTLLIDSGAAVAHRVVSLLGDVDRWQSGKQKRLAYCTVLDNHVAKLLPALQRYGLNELQRLIV